MLPQDSVARDICSQQVCEHSASVLNEVAFAVGKTLDQESEWYKQHTSSQVTRSTLVIMVLVRMEEYHVCVLVAQSCLTLCNHMDCSLPGSSVHGIFQARILEWVAVPFPGDLPDPEIEPGSPTLQANSLLSDLPGKNNIEGSKWSHSDTEP